MNRERFQRVAAIFEQAIGRDAAARSAFVAQACGDDEALRQEVDSLLARHRPEEPGRLDALQHTLLGEARGATPPESIGRYRVRRVIASGAMGTVYEAEQDDPHRTVALKVLRRGVTSPSMIARFRHEADFLGRLHHPHIAQIFDASTHDDGSGAQPWFAMEYVEGCALTEHARAGCLDARARVALLLKICEAVQHAHEQGVIHRDLKPENILVDARGEPRILDFGIARATDADLRVTTLETGAGVLVGTIPYMSPEQVSGHGRPDERSDVYALGVILFELLTGRLPHDLRGKSIPEAARIIQQDEPTSLGSADRASRGDLETIVAKALEKDPDRRYPSAAALAADLRHVLRDEPIVARPVSTLYQLRKFARRNPALVGGVVVSFALLLAGIVGVSWQLRATQDQVARFQELNDFVTRHLTLLNPGAIVDPLHPPTADGRLPPAEALLLDMAAQLETGFQRWPETRADLHLQLGLAFWGVGRFDDALSQVEDAVRLRTEHLGPDALETYRARMWRVRIIQRTSHTRAGLVEEATDVADRVARLPDAPPRDVLAARLIAADSLRRIGDTETTIRWEREVLARVEAALPGDPLLYDAAWQLAFSLGYVERHEEAEALVRPILERARAELDEHDLNLRRLAVRMADALNSLGRREEALVAAREAVRLGSLQAVPALTLYDMRAVNYEAGILNRLGRADEALEVLRARLERCSEHLGVHPYTFWAAAVYARALGAAGRDADGEALLRAELDAVAGSGLERDAHVGVMHAALAESLGRQQRVDEAVQHWREALGIVATLGQIEIELFYLRSLAELLEGAERWEEAAAVWREQLAKAESDYPSARQAIAQSRRQWASFLRRQGAPEDFEEAIRLADAAAEGLRDLGEHHWATQARRMQALMLIELGRPAEAQRMITRYLQDVEPELPPGSLTAPWLRVVLARCLSELGRFEDAEAEYLAVLDSLRAAEDPGGLAATRAEHAREDLAALYEAWGKPERAAEFAGE